MRVWKRGWVVGWRLVISNGLCYASRFPDRNATDLQPIFHGDLEPDL